MANRATPIAMMMMVRWSGWNRRRLADWRRRFRGRSPRSPSAPGPDQGRLAWLMQNRVAGMASRRAGSMATPQTSQRP